MFTRNCPCCGKELSYTKNYSLLRAVRNNCVCRSCSNRKIMSGKTLSPHHKESIKLNHPSRYGDWSPFSGKRHSVSSRSKMRDSRVAYLKTKPSGTFVSKSSTEFLDGLEKLWGKKIEREVELDGRFFDGRVGNLLIEVDGKYWHSQKRTMIVDKEKTQIAKKYGYTLRRFEVNSVKDVPKALEMVHE